MKKIVFNVEISMPDGDFLTENYCKDIEEILECDLNQDCEGRMIVIASIVKPIDDDWIVEKAAYSCPSNTTNKEDWIDGFVSGVEYILPANDNNR